MHDVAFARARGLRLVSDKNKLYICVGATVVMLRAYLTEGALLFSDVICIKSDILGPNTFLVVYSFWVTYVTNDISKFML